MSEKSRALLKHLDEMRGKLVIMPPDDTVTGYARGRADGYQAGVLSLSGLERAARRAALEEAEKIARGAAYRERYRTWPWWTNPDGSQGNRANESDIVRHADAIADAIRALPLPQEARDE